MTSPYLLPDLKRDEGCRLTAYEDTMGIWTIGYGHTGQDIHAGMIWSQEEADDTLAQDVRKTVDSLDYEIPWWRSLDDIRQDVLANMAFNLGVARLLTFDTFLAYVKTGQYEHAALDMMGTLWAHQVHARAWRLSQQMASGVHQP